MDIITGDRRHFFVPAVDHVRLRVSRARASPRVPLLPAARMDGASRRSAPGTSQCEGTGKTTGSWGTGRFDQRPTTTKAKNQHEARTADTRIKRRRRSTHAAHYTSVGYANGIGDDGRSIHLTSELHTQRILRPTGIDCQSSASTQQDAMRASPERVGVGKISSTCARKRIVWYWNHRRCGATGI